MPAARALRHRPQSPAAAPPHARCSRWGLAPGGLRAFADPEHRHDALERFYGGPVWAAHQQAANATIVDSGNVLLLRPVQLFSSGARGRRPLLRAAIHCLGGVPADAFADFFAAHLQPLISACGGQIAGCYVSDTHSPLRVLAVVVAGLGNPVFMASFWCLPTTFLKGESAAAGIALISSVGTTGGFFGPAIVGFLKDSAGGDTGAFFGLAVLPLVAGLLLLRLRQGAVFHTATPAVVVLSATQRG